MVGVPGRSKACHTCRRRRVKCGGELPDCLNCVKSKRICTGYRRKYAFILSQDMFSGGSSSTPGPPVSADGEDSGMVMVSRWRLPRENNCAPLLKDKRISRTTQDEEIALPNPISLHNVFRNKLFSLLVENDFSTNNGVNLVLGSRRDWMIHINDLPSLTPALEDALLAVATARLGRHASSDQLVHESLKLYTRSISKVRADIPDISNQKYEQSLATCLALLTYEVVECPSGTFDGYQAHYQGSMELLQRQGADAHKFGLAHSTFQVLRIHTVFQTLRQGQPTMLSQPEWRDNPWSSKPNSKAPFDHLVDILLDVSDSSARLKALKSMTDPRQKLPFALESICKYHETERSLEQWYQNFQAKLPGALYHVELSKINTAADELGMGKLFPVSFWFPAFIVGQNVLFYWVALMSAQAHLWVTYASLERISETLDSVGREDMPCTCDGTVDGTTRCLQHFAIGQLPSLEDRVDWPRLAHKICQSAEYFLQENVQGFGSANLLPALATVKSLLKHADGSWDREVAWINEMIYRMHMGGNGIAAAIGLKSGSQSR